MVGSSQGFGGNVDASQGGETIQAAANAGAEPLDAAAIETEILSRHTLGKVA